MSGKTIKNPKTLQSKSRQCIVTPTDCERHVKVQSTSGNVYDVWFTPKGAICSCPWGGYRPGVDVRSGCSHVLAANDYRERQNGNRVYAWREDQPEIVARQHRPTRIIGDNVVLTVRKESSL